MFWQDIICDNVGAVPAGVKAHRKYMTQGHIVLFEDTVAYVYRSANEIWRVAKRLCLRICAIRLSGYCNPNISADSNAFQPRRKGQLGLGFALGEQLRGGKGGTCAGEGFQKDVFHIQRMMIYGAWLFNAGPNILRLLSCFSASQPTVRRILSTVHIHRINVCFGVSAQKRVSGKT